MNRPALRSKSWRVGRSYTCTLKLVRKPMGGPLEAVFEWSPGLPAHLNDEELQQYRDGRNEAIRSLGLSALVVEV